MYMVKVIACLGQVSFAENEWWSVVLNGSLHLLKSVKGWGGGWVGLGV